jgi:adenylate cyclase
MPYEIERKFLVKDSFKEQALRRFRIQQGYLASGQLSNVRVRIKDNKGFLTIKGKTLPGGISRYEWEKEIPYDDAVELLKLCENSLIDKYRYEIQSGKHIFEVDEFLGNNQGLVVAEVELESEMEEFERPFWLGEEVSGDRKYNNSQLAKYPYSEWNKTDRT